MMLLLFLLLLVVKDMENVLLREEYPVPYMFNTIDKWNIDYLDACSPLVKDVDGQCIISELYKLVYN